MRVSIPVPVQTCPYDSKIESTTLLAVRVFGHILLVSNSTGDPRTTDESMCTSLEDRREKEGRFSLRTIRPCYTVTMQCLAQEEEGESRSRHYLALIQAQRRFSLQQPDIPAMRQKLIRSDGLVVY